jgi:tRNA-2-methylthio-N6-dimethylallyladenosine synthase
VSGRASSSYSVFIETYGCQMNVYDSMAIDGLLRAAGLRLAEDADGADVVLLNSCSVRDHAEHRVISRAGELGRRRRDGLGPAVVGVCGCMAERLGEQLLAMGHGIDLVVGVDQYDRLPRLLLDLLQRPDGLGRVATGHREAAHYVAPPAAYPAHNSHLVSIHKGCNYRCTYCVVPLTRGPQHEKAPEVIMAEIERIIAGGGREVTLLGQNVTAYRWRQELDFAGLLSQLAGLPGLARIRFLTGHPCDMSDALLAVMAAKPQICPSLHLPMQSGSDRVLKRMKRIYTRERYLDLIARTRRILPEVTFSSDFIVGFPGETDHDFRATLEAVQRVKYDQVFAFKYSPRPGAPASRLKDDVPLAVKKDRLAALMDAQKEVWQETASLQIGRVWTVIVEGAARRPPGAWLGRTANNRKVLVARSGLKVGDELSVRIRGFQNTTFQGEPLVNPR